jgi:CcmD family protein
MEKIIKSLAAILLLISFATTSIVAGPQPEVEMADTMRSEGKIYVVVGIILIVLIGLFVYLFLLDKKVKKLENLLSEKQHSTK